MLALAVLALVAHAVANTIPYPPSMTKGFHSPSVAYSQGGNAICVSGNVSIEASAEGRQVSLPGDLNQFQVTDFVLQYLLNQGKLDAQIVGGPQTISGTFKIAAVLCVPKHLARDSSLKTLQILNHGLGSDKSYWDIAPGYSYVDAMAAAGYATLNFDRLGAGASEHPDPINVVQFPIQPAILHGLVELARGAHIGSSKFEKIVLVGHSFGSGIVLADLGQYPQDADGVILQSRGTNISSLSVAIAVEDVAIANQNDPAKFGELANGYLVYGTAIAFQFLNYKYPFFDVDIFNLRVDERSTYSLGENFIPAPAAVASAASFTAPADVVSGEFDFQVCGESCFVPDNQAAAALPLVLPNASAGSQSFVVPQAGHNINGHFSAPQAFAHSIGFLKANGF